MLHALFVAGLTHFVESQSVHSMVHGRGAEKIPQMSFAGSDAVEWMVTTLEFGVAKEKRRAHAVTLFRELANRFVENVNRLDGTVVKERLIQILQSDGTWDYDGTEEGAASVEFDSVYQEFGVVRRIEDTLGRGTLLQGDSSEAGVVSTAAAAAARAMADNSRAAGRSTHKHEPTDKDGAVDAAVVGSAATAPPRGSKQATSRASARGLDVSKSSGVEEHELVATVRALRDEFARLSEQSTEVTQRLIDARAELFRRQSDIEELGIALSAEHSTRRAAVSLELSDDALRRRQAFERCVSLEHAQDVVDEQVGASISKFLDPSRAISEPSTFLLTYLLTYLLKLLTYTDVYFPFIFPSIYISKPDTHPEATVVVTWGEGTDLRKFTMHVAAHHTFADVLSELAAVWQIPGGTVDVMLIGANGAALPPTANVVALFTNIRLAGGNVIHIVSSGSVPDNTQLKQFKPRVPLSSGSATRRKEEQLTKYFRSRRFTEREGWKTLIILVIYVTIAFTSVNFRRNITQAHYFSSAIMNALVTPSWGAAKHKKGFEAISQLDDVWEYLLDPVADFLFADDFLAPRTETIDTTWHTSNANDIANMSRWPPWEQTEGMPWRLNPLRPTPASPVSKWFWATNAHIGAVRLHQYRMKKECRTRAYDVIDCKAVGEYGPGKQGNRSAFVYNSLPAEWQSNFVGYFSSYDWSGYIVDLPLKQFSHARLFGTHGHTGTNGSAASELPLVGRRKWQKELLWIRDNAWLDTQTAALLISFNMYNANADIICCIKLLLELSQGGVWRHRIALRTSEAHPLGTLHQIVFTVFDGLLLLLSFAFAGRWIENVRHLEKAKIFERTYFGQRRMLWLYWFYFADHWFELGMVLCSILSAIFRVVTAIRCLTIDEIDLGTQDQYHEIYGARVCVCVCSLCGAIE